VKELKKGQKVAVYGSFKNGRIVVTVESETPNEDGLWKVRFDSGFDSVSVFASVHPKQCRLLKKKPSTKYITGWVCYYVERPPQAAATGALRPYDDLRLSLAEPPQDQKHRWQEIQIRRQNGSPI